jgi:hypothetical protein
MATQVIGAVRRSRRSVILVGVALAFAIAVLVAQASSIWSSENGSSGRSVRQVSLSTRDLTRAGHLPAGCRPKYGCTGGTNSERP